MSACGPRDTGVEALPAGRGSALPFLPTLATACVVAAASLLCRAPPAPAPMPAPVVAAQAAPAGGDGFHPATPAHGAAPVIPSTLAFGLHPPALPLQVAEVEEAVKPPAAHPVRAAAPARRPCAAPRCGEGRRIEAARAAPAPQHAASEPAAVPQEMRDPFVARRETEDGLLPEGALPFVAKAAATATSLVDGARRIGGSVGSGAASLGGSVVDLLASDR